MGVKNEIDYKLSGIKSFKICNTIASSYIIDSINGYYNTDMGKILHSTLLTNSNMDITFYFCIT